MNLEIKYKLGLGGSPELLVLHKAAFGCVLISQQYKVA